MHLDILANISSFLSDIFKPKEKVIESRIEEVDESFDIDEDYLNLFQYQSIESEDYLLGREKDMNLLSRAYDSWKETGNPLLVIGEPGMGTTSLLTSSLKLYDNVHIMEDGVALDTKKDVINALKPLLGITKDVATFEELASLLSEGKHVIILENIERLFLRKVNGFSLLDDFILFVYATRSSIYWILTINTYSYYFLDRVRDFSSNFNSIIYLKPLEKDAIKEIVSGRNEGYEVNYLKPKRISPGLKAKLDSNSTQNQFLLESDFYSRLMNFSEGNISRAFLYWTKSIRRTSGKKIYMKPFEPKKLSDVNLEEILILEAIMQHTSLSVQELRQVLRKTTKGGQLALAKLMEKDILIYKHYKGSPHPEYQVNPMYQPEIRMLMKTRLNRNLKL